MVEEFNKALQVAGDSHSIASGSSTISSAPDLTRALPNNSVITSANAPQIASVMPTPLGVTNYANLDLAAADVRGARTLHEASPRSTRLQQNYHNALNQVFEIDACLLDDMSTRSDVQLTGLNIIDFAKDSIQHDGRVRTTYKASMLP